MTPEFVVDPLWYRTTDGLGVLAGAPMSFFRVTGAGARVLDALEVGAELAAGHESLTERLCAVGAIHPLPTVPARASDVTVVVPTCSRNSEDVARVSRLASSLAPLRVVVADDASPAPLSDSLRADDRVTIVRLDVNSGPGAARNAGLARVVTPVVVFVDDDADVEPGAILSLASLVTTDKCAVAAPRVASTPVASPIGEYETFRSPLDMGSSPALVRRSGRVTYVPSAVLACNIDAVRDLGGFDESMRTGEDVDLVWRLTAAGRPCRYVPSVHASHAPRRSAGAFARQRFAYGRSAARLDAIHPWSVAPFRGHPLVALPGLCLLGGFPALAVPLALVVVAWLSFSLRSIRLGFVSTWRLAMFAMSNATMLLANAVRRTWWPVMIVLAPFTRAVAVALAVSILVPMARDLVRNKPRHVLTYSALRVIDDACYGAGVWRGAIGERSPRCLLPVFSVRRSVAR